MCRNDIQVCSHLHEFCLAHRILTLCGFRFQQLLISLTKYHDCVTVDEHGFEFIFLVDRFRVIHEIKSVDSCLYFLFVISVSPGEYIFAAACMSRTSLLHELGKHTGCIAFSPLVCHAGDQLVLHGLAFPVWYYDLFLVFDILLCHSIVNDSTVVHDVHVFDSVTCQLRECRRGLRVLSLFTDDKLSFSKIKSLLAEVLPEHHRSQNRK